MLFSLSSLLSVMFTQMNHPLAMGMILLIQTTLISIITGMMAHSFWFSYILFLIFLGGMLVLFIYVASLASNELFSLSTNMMLTMSVSFLMIMWLLYLSYPNIQNQEIKEFLVMSSSTNLPLIKLYNQPTSIITILLALYLFLTLIAVVKITNIFKGPLRQMN
uniref:NADH-ubiquinone oxidoreductase chain 6 n=1 Tax=Phoetalia pallida TaxID=36957 RepID=A0A2P1H7J4_9NEOP|nr:NADH dehydrogenase subunit 6 [Phoetalia pallida]